MTVEISILLAMVGCFVGLAGWLKGRDGKIAGDGEWRGSVNTKLDQILGITADIKSLEEEQKCHGERLTAVEASAKQAHKRIDRLEGREDHET